MKNRSIMRKRIRKIVAKLVDRAMEKLIHKLKGCVKAHPYVEFRSIQKGNKI